MKYTFLSKWTVLLLTLGAGGLATLGYSQLFGLTAPDFQSPQLRGLLAILAGVVAYACAWFVALADSLQERKWAWSIALVVLLPLLIGPLLYSFFGPRNTR